LKKLLKLFVGFKLGLQSGLAETINRFDTRALLVIGLAATGISIASFAIEGLLSKKSGASTDFILKSRLSSPAPSSRIVIVDIDERSLALLGQTKGKWPWPRDTLADGLQKLSDLGARSIMFNILMSDPDIHHADADAAMEVTAALVPQVIFPIVRLEKNNDGLSQLTVDKLPGAKLIEPSTKPPPIAVILPVFASMRDRAGVANLWPDSDGIVRSYPLRWSEEKFKLPSIVMLTADAGGVDTRSLPDRVRLNWRNKKGNYQRISFVDLLNMDPASESAKMIKDSFIVLGLSAPGIGQTKPTAVKGIEDDNEIMATALDDTINDSHLRTAPAWLLLLISISATWAIVWLGIQRVAATKINRAFVLIQLSLAAVSLLAASYTYLLIDLSSSMSFALAVFALVKVVRAMSDNSARAKPGFRKFDATSKVDHLIMVGFQPSVVGTKAARQWEIQVRRLAGIRQIIRIDNLYAETNFLTDVLADYEALVILSDKSNKDSLLSIFNSVEGRGLRIMEESIPADMSIASDAFKLMAARMLAKNASLILDG
jgi:CHASE2 domain-containing sensor protein